MTYGSGATGNYFDYDVMGRVTKQFQLTGSSPTKYKLTYAYNSAGLLTNEVYPSGRSMTYAYDDGGRLSSVGDGTTTFAGSFNYSAHGGLTSETFGNTAVHELAYNRRLQASQVKLSLVSTVLQQYDYGYGEFNTSSGSVDTSKNNGQIGKVTATIGTTAQWNQGFNYDELGRLSSFVEHQGSAMTTTNYSHGYTYDRYGNRFQTADSTLGLPAVSSTDIVPSTNRFITTGSTPTTYDQAGNITVDAKFRGNNYSYDANGRMTSSEYTDHANHQDSVYDAAGQRVQTSANGLVRTMVYDIFGQQVADYAGSAGTTLERENIYRGGQLLATNETLTAGQPSSLAATPSSSNIALSWTAGSGASKYRVERRAAGTGYELLTTTTSASTTDSGASSGSAYLYRVCSADSNNNCTSDYSNIALGAKLNFTTDATICAFSDSPTCSPLTEMKAAHITELRTAINAVRTLASESGGSWTHSGLATDDLIYADDIRDLRTALNYALSALNIQTSSYTDNTIITYADDPLNATPIKASHIRELRTRSTSGTGDSTSGGSSGGLHYVLSDLQGSSRAVINNNSSSSAIVARHDYLPFGEEIGSGIGSRTLAQGYNASDGNRWKYAMTERDATSGLDDTWFRKYESLSGRWTSPDPYRGNMSVSDPQTFQRFSFIENDAVNAVDPFGLCGYWIAWINNPDGTRTITGQSFDPCYVTVGGHEIGGGGGPDGGGDARVSYFDNPKGRDFGENPLIGNLDDWPPQRLIRNFGWPDPAAKPKIKIPDLRNPNLDNAKARVGARPNLQEEINKVKPSNFSRKGLMDSLGNGLKDALQGIDILLKFGGCIIPPVVWTPEMECAVTGTCGRRGT